MMKLGVSMRGLGYHASAWRQPGVPRDGDIDLNFYRNIVDIAERGLFDMAFLADYVAVKTVNSPAGFLGRTSGMIGFEPLTLLSALAPMTRHIGLAATTSTTFSHPYHIARSFASLDHLSKGRAAWNVVTSFQDDEARNFGDDSILAKTDRYARATEAVGVVTGLWDSWDEDAFPRDTTTGQYFRPDKMRYLDHSGEHFRSRGPLNVPRTPQGRPVIIQAGASPEGQELAAATADVVYAAHHTMQDAQAFYRSLKGRMARHGRQPDDLKIMPGLLPVLGRTREEAQEKYRVLQEAIDPIVGLGALVSAFGDLSGHDLDGPVPELRTDTALMSRSAVKLQIARREGLTIRQLYQRTTIGNAHHVVVGTAADVADDMEAWFANGAADGFNILPALSPGSLIDFVDLVVPELQARGLFRTEYEGTTLRDNLGLRKPSGTVEAGDRA